MKPIPKRYRVSRVLAHAARDLVEAPKLVSVLVSTLDQAALNSLLRSQFRVEPVVGIEPTTDGLQNRCSTAELNWLSQANLSTTRQRVWQACGGREASHSAIIYDFGMCASPPARSSHTALRTGRGCLTLEDHKIPADIRRRVGRLVWRPQIVQFASGDVHHLDQLVMFGPVVFPPVKDSSL